MFILTLKHTKRSWYPLDFFTSASCVYTGLFEYATFVTFSNHNTSFEQNSSTPKKFE